MTEKELLESYSVIYKTAFDANNYYQLLMQYYKYRNENLEIFKFSPAFWVISKNALSYACLMQVAKLYDKSDKAIGIQLFFSKDSYSYLSKLKTDHVITKSTLYKFFEIPIDSNDYSRYNDLSIQEILGVLSQRKKDLEDQIELLHKYRNKGYAHNDKSKVLSPDDFKDIPPLEKETMKELIDFALKTCRMIKYYITGAYGTDAYSNIDDIYGLIQLLQFGMYEQKKMEDCLRKGINYHPPTVYESGD